MGGLRSGEDLATFALVDEDGCLEAFVLNKLAGSWGSKGILDFIFVEGDTRLDLGKSVSTDEVGTVEGDDLGSEGNGEGFCLAGYTWLSVESEVRGSLGNRNGFSMRRDEETLLSAGAAKVATARFEVRLGKVVSSLEGKGCAWVTFSLSLSSPITETQDGDFEAESGLEVSDDWGLGSKLSSGKAWVWERAKEEQRLSSLECPSLTLCSFSGRLSWSL